MRQIVHKNYGLQTSIQTQVAVASLPQS